MSERGRDRMEAITRRLGATSGQVWTISIGMVVALLLAILGIPPTMRDRPAAAPRASPVLGEAPPPGLTVPSPEEFTTPFVLAQPASPRPPPSPPPPPSPEADEAVAPTPPPFDPPEAPLGFGAARLFATVGEPGVPEGVAVAPDGRVYVATNNAPGRGGAGPSFVFRYTSDGTLQGHYVIGGQPSAREHGFTGLVMEGGGLLYILDASTGRILRLEPEEGATSTYATIPDLPACLLVVAPSACEPGLEDRLPVPKDAAFGPDGAMYVSDHAQSTVWRVPPGGGTPEVFHQSLDYASGRGPAGLAFDDGGNLYLAVTALADIEGSSSGAVYRMRIEDGSVAERSLVAALPDGADPLGLTLGISGRIYVALQGQDALLVLEAGGDEVDRLTDVLIEAPVGVAFQGSTILVTSQPVDGAPWTVVAVGVDDAQARAPGG